MTKEINYQGVKEIWDAGLIWLVNAAILHPRGYALAVHFDDDEKIVGLSVVGDGQEVWCFGQETPMAADERSVWQSDAAYQRFVEAEASREADWTSKLTGATE